MGLFYRNKQSDVENLVKQSPNHFYSSESYKNSEMAIDRFGSYRNELRPFDQGRKVPEKNRSPIPKKYNRPGKKKHEGALFRKNIDQKMKKKQKPCFRKK
jgi:hypothetical protein